MKRFLIAPDKFKGCLGALEVARAIERGVVKACSGAECEVIPLADGGDGTLASISYAIGCEPILTHTHDALGLSCNEPFGLNRETGTAVIEMSIVCGLARTPIEDRNPLFTSTRGLGELLRAASEGGAKRVYIGLGGSATNDGGAGMAAALGYKFWDADDMLIDPLPASLPRVARIEAPDALDLPEIIALSDVQNPLLGERGASRVFAPQKGATPEVVEQLEEALSHLVSLVRRDLGKDSSHEPGAGAAGGLGYGLSVFSGAVIESGFEAISELIGLPDAVRRADCVITGEGTIDATTLHGKGPFGLARLARDHGKPVIALAGCLRDRETLASAFDACLGIADRPMTMEESLNEVDQLLEFTAEQAVRLILLPTR